MSQYFGMKNEKRVKDALGNSIYLMLGMGILVSIISGAVSRTDAAAAQYTGVHL